MQSNWEAAHSQALRDFLAKGMSYSEIADALNARFGTAYSRNAAIGRAKRLGLASPDRSTDNFQHWPKRPPRARTARLSQPRERHVPESMRPLPAFERAELPKLRCVEIVPRRLSLVDLEGGDCRYPYGGEEEGEAITFCGHPQQDGSSYCTPHFHLTRNPDLRPGRPAGSAAAGGCGMSTSVATILSRTRLLPRRHRIAHLRTLLRRQPAGSLRRGQLAALLRAELAARQPGEERPA